MDCGLFHSMENFILKEIDYSQQYGYSSRAKRYMRRKLNKELAPYIENDSLSESELVSEMEPHISESIMLSSTSVNICLVIAYICIVSTFYGITMYMVHDYSKETKTC